MAKLVSTRSVSLRGLVRCSGVNGGTCVVGFVHSSASSEVFRLLHSRQLRGLVYLCLTGVREVPEPSDTSTAIERIDLDSCLFLTGVHKVTEPSDTSMPIDGACMSFVLERASPGQLRPFVGDRDEVPEQVREVRFVL